MTSRTTLNNLVTGGVSDFAIGVSTASQLPGRGMGGPADVLRHLVLSAELTRRFGDETAVGLLNAHEFEDPNPLGADTAHDAKINSIGIAIGDFVSARGGTYLDVVELSLQAIELSFAGYSWINAGLAPESGGAWIYVEGGIFCAADRRY